MKMNKEITLSMEERAEKINSILLEQEADFTVQYLKTWKNNVEREGYMLRNSGKCFVNVYYDESWYNKPDEEVIEFLTNMNEGHKWNFDCGNILNPSHILSHILPKLVSADNKTQLQKRGIAHMDFLNMCILFYINLNNGPDDEPGTIQITNDILEKADITLNDACKCAIANLEQKIEVKTMFEILSDRFDIDLGDEAEDDLKMWICTTKDNFFGAAAMLCPIVIEKLKEYIGEKVAILPSSVHECIAIPYESEEDFSNLVDMVSNINSTELDIEDKLTDSVYFIENGKLKIAR